MRVAENFRHVVLRDAPGQALGDSGLAHTSLNKQAIGVLLAGALCVIVSRVDLDYLRRYAWWIGGISLLLLTLVVIPQIGIMVNGSRRWLGIGAARFQVSEFAKLGLVFCLAHYLALNQTRIGEWKRGFLWPLGLIGA
ncbi:MAG: FtsW/RodA/SpoVE family cell cycle protein, partial [Cytophagales bacterium]|nr:FtsW/RodA/SpoVE family cell cycle protein [Rhizobacter sp.]